MIKVIIFDLGNVIVDCDKSVQFRKFAKLSKKPVSCIESYFKNSRKNFEKGMLTPKQFYNKVANELNINVSFEEFKKTWYEIFTLNKDVADLIRKLKKRHRLILLSNTDELHFNYIKNKFKIINTFDDYSLSFKIGFRKPNPMIFLDAIKKAKTMPFNCAYFDDIQEFVYVARFLGIKAFHYKNFVKLKKDLMDIGALN